MATAVVVRGKLFWSSYRALRHLVGLQEWAGKRRRVVRIHSESGSGLRLQQVAANAPLSPAVRYLVETNKIDPSTIPPTGPRNRLLKGDVLKYMHEIKSGLTPAAVKPVSKLEEPVRQPPSLPRPHPPSTAFTDIPLTNMRRTIAKRLTQSKTTIPYCYATSDCIVDNLLSMRRQLMREDSVRLTVNDFLIKAAALTLQRLPESNSCWAGEGIVRRLPSVDISVAIATEGGLITPILRGANRLTVQQISSRMKEFADKARSGKLQPHEYQGGSFSISNLGMYGIKEFTAIINSPQSAILSVGSIEAAPAPVSHNEGRGVMRVVRVTLSCDARVIHYELACQWLEVFKGILQSPTAQGLL